MKQIVNTADGGYEVLKLQEAADPVAGPGEAVIDVRAAGLNFADILARKGQYPDGPSKPCVMGYEVSGVVSSVGEGADPSWEGKEVIAMCRFGGQAEKVRVKERQLFEKPDQLNFEQAAALPVNYLTAWVLIHVMGSLTPDESVLIHNAGGGMGLALLDIARHIGAVTYGTASPRKHDFLAGRGLDYPIDYRNNDWYEVLMELTNGKGVELILDPIGGKEWKKSYKALRATGRLGMFGISTASTGKGGAILSKLRLLKTVIGMPLFHPLSLLGKNRGVYGVNMGHLWHEPEKARRWINSLLQGVREGWISPHVDRTFAFEAAAKAHCYIEERKNIGKVILVP